LDQYARSGVLVPLDSVGGHEVRLYYSMVWRQLGSVDGRLYGVWFKAANKSLVWYNISVFERAMVVPPEDIEGLLAVAGKLRRAGVAPFALGVAQGWAIADWFSNLYLATQGPRKYDLLAEHRIRWTDPSVEETLRLLGTLLQPANLAGGPSDAVRTSFQQAVIETFAEVPRAAMVSEGDFVAGVISGSTSAKIGVEADVFKFPGFQTAASWVIGGGDVAVMMRPSPGAEALVRYLATPEAGGVWAALGGFISPNLGLGPAVYPDDVSRSVALDVVDAGDDFRFGLADLQPVRFGATPGQGLYEALQEFIVKRDAAATAAQLEASARAAYGA
jgi:ABC-type glycerol-3-phosphate transport system substrate-binding protein